jgi:putative DNA primase/helicase
MDNYQDVLQQMQQFGIELRPDKDLPLHLDTPKSRTCGKGGKDWYKLYTFTPRSGGSVITGTFGTYRHGGSSQKVEVDWKPMGEAEKAKFREEREAAERLAREKRAAEVANAAAEAIDVWRKAARSVEAPYLEARGLRGESCRVLKEQVILRWTAERPGDDDTVVRLPGGTLLVPLVRLDFPRDQALRGLQFIRPEGAKIYLRGFEKPGCCVRLGNVDENARLLLVCEGYATGLALRLGVDKRFPVFVAFDCGNLAHLVPILRTLYPLWRILICADDDWKTYDRNNGQLTNPGRTMAKKVAKDTAGCDLVWPVFAPATRQDKDTDFDDLRQREGLATVRRQLHGVISMMGRVYG